MNKLDAENIIKHFEGKIAFETADIANFYRQTEPQITATTVNWRIHSLIKNGVIQRVGRGKFALGKERKFVPELSEKLKSIYKKIKNEFPFLTVCVWRTSVFNEFMLHQPGKFYNMIEVEKEAAEAVFYFLKEKGLNVFLNPNHEILEKYLPENKDIFVVKSLISKAPIQEIDGTITITIEKLLVDIFCDAELFTAQQGAEMRTIFAEVCNRYAVSQDKMFSYAARRMQENSFKKYIITYTIKVQ